MSNEVTIKCHWCGGEFKMEKSALEGTMDTGIQISFNEPFAVFSGKKQITGEIVVHVTPLECDICERCALAILSGTLENWLITRNIDPKTWLEKK